MEELKIYCVSNWLEIEYDGDDPYVEYEGEKMMISDLIRLDKHENRLVDFDDMVDEDRFPRFIETSANGKSIRLWKVSNEEDDNPRDVRFDRIGTRPEVLDVFNTAGIHTFGDLVDMPKNEIRLLAGNDKELLNKIMYVEGIARREVNKR